MKLYHGSPNNYNVIRKNQAQAGDGINVPEKELQNAIYLTPSFEFALAIASMPDGSANIDNETMIIQFEKPELFDPKKNAYIYEVDSETIPPENVDKVDELQIAILNTDEIKPTAKKLFKAGDVEKYFEIKKEPLEVKKETKINPEFKIK